jgi:hypothetical protein
MRWLCFVVLLASGANLAAGPGVVRTLDGRTLDGELRLTNGFVLVVSTNPEPATVALSNLLAAEFDVAAAATNDAVQGRGAGLLGHYFGNTNLSGNVVVRLDQTIDFDWGTREPAPGVTADAFSVAWTGEVEAPASGNFTFSISADDGARLDLEDTVIAETVGRWNGKETASEPTPLEAGKKYRLKFTCYDRNGPARARLSWSGPGFSRVVIPKEQLYPKSLLPEHTSDIFTNHGLLAT